jgi:hypothetical protein
VSIVCTIQLKFAYSSFSFFIASDVGIQDDRKWTRRSILLSLVLILLFDTVILVFLFVVFVKQKGSTDHNSVLSASDPSKNESISEIFDVTIQKGMFDIVILSLMRCLTGLICYGVLRWITRLPIILTTVVSTIYIIAKAGLYEVCCQLCTLCMYGMCNKYRLFMSA